MKEKINEHEMLVDCGGIKEMLLIHPLVDEKETEQSESSLKG